MANGVSLSPLRKSDDGKPEPGTPWRVRWREWVLVDGERKRKQRERTFHHPPGSKARTAPAVAVKFHAEVLEALQAGTLAELGEAAPVRREVASFDRLCEAWLRHKVSRGAAEGSLRIYGSCLDLWFPRARAALGLPEAVPIPVDRLSRDLWARVILALQADGYAESTIYTTCRVMLEAWTFGSDEPEDWPGIRPAPRTKSSVLPLVPVYSPPPAPTLAECDAAIRHMPKRSYTAKGAAVLLRWTGLRIRQVYEAKRRDLDLAAMTLTVTSGKSRREKAARRVIPVSRAMLDDFAPYLGSDPDGPLLRRRSDHNGRNERKTQRHPTIRAGWEAATAAGEARREVWDPATRGNARPQHAFRAALQAHMERAGVRSEVIDAIVGHAPKTTRARHYVSDEARWAAMREAVDALPPIDWRGSVEDELDQAVGGGEVVEFRRG